MFCKRVFFKTLQKGFGTPTKRFFAFFIDILTMYLVLIMRLLYKLAASEPYRREVGAYLSGIITKGETYYVDDFNALSLKMFGVYFLYSLIMQWLPTKGTLSQRWLELEVNTDGTNRFLAVFIRNLLKVPVMILWPITYILSRTNSKGLWLHDQLSKSVMLDIEEK